MKKTDMKNYLDILNIQDFDTTMDIKIELTRSGIDRALTCWKIFTSELTMGALHSSLILTKRTAVRHLLYPITIYKAHQLKTNKSKLNSCWQSVKLSCKIPMIYLKADWNR